MIIEHSERRRRERHEAQGKEQFLDERRECAGTDVANRRTLLLQISEHFSAQEDIFQ